ncbi:hypothetical protein OsI_20950 [Oryza sativa Indica Group]|uniref:Uncharacterized protein n=4 Tax=Oryza TaxID=4527 RepID=Q6AT36_ORYSJ|nr:hypothetical protein [Oryza sativa Japonica Group]EAY98992.1 hypothetical protein OsI_20950 [Oryza sativa Indica Group]EEE64664.1 hypothetical protein OsJ_19518 [Oryza sativa Japonica Group]
MMHAGGAGGNRDDGSSDPWKRKGDKKKKKDDKPKERKRGFGVAKLEIIRIQSELAEQKRKNELAEQEKRQNAQQGPPQIPDGTTDGLMHYGSEGMGAMNFGQSQSTPLRPPGTFGASSYSNTNIISGPPGAFGAAYYPYSNNIMLPANEVTMAQPLSQVPNSQELIDLMREGGHSTSAGESTSKNSDEDPEGLDLELRL